MRRFAAGVALVVAGLAVLWLARPEPDPPAGRWFPYRTHRFDPDLSPEQREELEALEAIGYVGGTLAPGERAAGVFVHEPDASTALRFYVSGDGPVARVIDATGTVHHTWRGDFWAHFPGYPVARDHGATDNWRRARLLPDGSVVAVHEGLGMVRIDRDSRLLWANPGRHHHDLHVAGDEIVALAREARIDPAIDPKRPVLEDRVVWLSVDDGVELRAVSVFAALRRSKFASELPRRRGDGDLLHTNALWVLDGSMEQPAFAAGNILLSFRETSALAVLDPRLGEVVWVAHGTWRKQHDPQPDGAGRLVVFDNLGASGAARVIWLDGQANVVRAWAGHGEPLHSAILGAVEPLPDGAVWVAESERGTVWEVDPAGRVRWAFANPARTGADGALIAAIFEMEPVDPAWVPVR
jgi:hypothetical protein